MVEIASINTNNLLLSVVVRDRTGVLYEGEAEAVSSLNEKGPFDVLPLHTNFISIISGTVTLHLRENIAKEITIQKGVLTVRENRVEVYLGILH